MLSLIVIILLAVSCASIPREGKGSSIFWDTVFRGIGYELMYLRMNDGKLLQYTTYNKLIIDRTDFFIFLKKKGYTVSQIKVCIHNHPYSIEFSEGDKKFYSQIVKVGFKGKFLVYYRGKIAEYKDK